MLRNICFTINNPTDEAANSLKEWDKLKYLVCGSETGESVHIENCT